MTGMKRAFVKSETVPNRDTVADAVCEIMTTTLNVARGSITPETGLDSDLGIDSMALIETQVAIEERFGITMLDVDEMEARAPKTVNDLVDVVLEQMAVAKH